MNGETPDRSDITDTIHAMPYTHADIAWVHTRAWHIDRYVRLMDEVLQLFETNPDYHYYIDTWVELMKPYLERRPDAIGQIRRHVREGRLAVCAGQFGNVRSTAVGDETQIRNIQLGMRRWREVAPEVHFRVYSNIDVTCGHTQMPQLLSLSGLDAYLVMRPLAALDAQGIPRVCVWRGLSGDTVVLYRDTGVGVFQEHERHGASWDEDWPAASEHIWATYLRDAARCGIPSIGLSLGVDDSRPDRFAFSDTVADYGNLIREWNAREASRMRYGTPDTLIADVMPCRDELVEVDAVLDPTCVSFNIALNGRRGIWWLRELADRRLVEAEILSALAVLVAGTVSPPAERTQTRFRYPEQELDALWETLLCWTPHAVQWLFLDDWQEGELALRTVADSASRRGYRAAEELVGGALPADAQTIALIDPLPGARREIVPFWIVNSDLTRGFAGLRDARGNAVPVQVTGYPMPNAETMCLAEVDVVGCGYTTFSIDWEPMPDGLDYQSIETHWRQRHSLPPSARPVNASLRDGSAAAAALAIDNGAIRLRFETGRLTHIEDLCFGSSRIAPDGVEFLEPICYAIERTGWSSDAMSDEPARFTPTDWHVDETGPLRWRMTRTGTAGGWWIRQHLDLHKGESAVRSTIRFVGPGDNNDSVLAVGLPALEHIPLRVDIPFGVEARPVDDIAYGVSERAIAGLFWGRTWAAATDDLGTVALIAADGDKQFRAAGAPRRLAHLIAQKTRMFETGWEAQIATHDVGGDQVFRHALWLGAPGGSDAGLIRFAERLRHPVLAMPALAPMGSEHRVVRLSPETLCLSALRFEAGELIVRVVQMSAESCCAELELPVAPRAAALIDLCGAQMSPPVERDRCVVRFAMGPWQIATLRISLGDQRP